MIWRSASASLDSSRKVRTAFWKEEPQLHYAFDLVESPEVFAVPVFMADGYFTDRVVPRELGLEGRRTVRGWTEDPLLPPGRHRPTHGSDRSGSRR